MILFGLASRLEQGPGQDDLLEHPPSKGISSMQINVV